MAKDHEKPLSAREKIIVKLIVFVIQMLKPYEFEHQFNEVWKDIKNSLGQE